MNKRRLWTLTTVLGLAVGSMHLTFLLLGQYAVRAARNGPAAIADMQPSSANFTVFGSVFVTDGDSLTNNLDICSGVWVSETIDSAGDVGWYTSLALDRGGNPHISYFDNTNAALKYAWLSGTAWLSETVDSMGRSPYYGSGTSLELDQADAPYISYYDAINDDLKLAHRKGTVWISQTVDGDGDVGPYSSLALDRVGCPHISYYDATNGDLKYAYIPPVEIYLPIIMKN